MLFLFKMYLGVLGVFCIINWYFECLYVIQCHFLYIWTYLNNIFAIFWKYRKLKLSVYIYIYILELRARFARASFYPIPVQIPNLFDNWWVGSILSYILVIEAFCKMLWSLVQKTLVGAGRAMHSCRESVSAVICWRFVPSTTEQHEVPKPLDRYRCQQRASDRQNIIHAPQNRLVMPSGMFSWTTSPKNQLNISWLAGWRLAALAGWLAVGFCSSALYPLFPHHRKCGLEGVKIYKKH